MSKVPETREIKVGKTTVKLEGLVRDATGIMDILEDSITDPMLGWAERRLQQIRVRLNFFPSAIELREWDQILLGRYHPVYTPTSEMCTNCTIGPCNLVGSKGACGIDMNTKMAKESLLESCKGAAIQLTHARALLKEALKRYDRDKEISHGKHVRYPSINSCVLVGFEIYNLDDADKSLAYAEQQLSELLDSTTFGNVSDVMDLEEKALHAGSLDLLGGEVAELIKESCFDLCSASNIDLVDLGDFPHFIDQGVASVDRTKPTILFSGNSIVEAEEAVKYLKGKDLLDKVEVCGIGAVGLDLGRYYEGTKNVGTALNILKIIRIGLPDVLVVGDLCMNMNVLEETKKVGIPVVATTPTTSMGLKDRTDDDVKTIVSDLSEGKVEGVLVLDLIKAAEVAVEVAQKVCGKRSGKKYLPEIGKEAEKCIGCGRCVDACPNDLMISEAMGAAKSGNSELLSEVYDSCIFCAKCEGACSKEIPVMNLILKSAEGKMDKEKYRMRPGRGTPAELEFRDVAFAFGFGTVSGIVAIVGCSAYDGSSKDVGFIANKLIELNYLVLTAGCAATDMAGYYNEFKESHMYDAWGSLFQIEGLLNCGSCSALSHIARGFYKYTHVIARTPMRGNFTEQADYVFGKLPCAVIMWGPVSEHMYSAAAGFARMGATVVVGPHGAKFKRFLLGDRESREKWWCYDGFTGEKHEVEPCPPHLIVPVETKEEALVMVTRLLFRTNDFRDGRISKFDSYITMYEEYFKSIPEDFPLFVRADAELPWTKKHKLLRILREKYGWETEKGMIKKAKHRDGRLMDPEQFAGEYGIRVGQYSTFISRLVLNEDARGTALDELKKGGEA